MNNFHMSGKTPLPFNQFVDTYRPTIFLLIVLMSLSTISIVWAQLLLHSGNVGLITPSDTLVSSQISEFGRQIGASAHATGEASLRQAITVLTAAIALTVLIAVGAVGYLNIALVRVRRELRRQSTDLRSTKLLKERFLVSATHVLNTPLTVTNALTDVLAKNREGNLTERQLQQLAAVQRNNQHITDMVDVMIQTSAAKSDNAVQAESIQYSEFIENALASIQADLDLQGVKIEWSVVSSNDRITIDSDRISQVVSNLIINAGQNSPEGAIVFVSTERVEDQVVTRIRDFGPGISQVDQPHVFSPFYRGDTETTRRIRAVGLGLTLVKRIVESHGGEVGFESNPNDVGVTFCFTLPIAC